MTRIHPLKLDIFSYLAKTLIIPACIAVIGVLTSVVSGDRARRNA